MNLLITGASGFLGGKTLEQCARRGIRVHALGRTPVSGAAFTQVDILDEEAARNALREIQPTHILHLASRGVTRDESAFRDMLLANTVATDNLLRAASQLPLKPRVVLMGTAYEYASTERPLTEESKIDPKSPYAISKSASAFAMSRYADALPMLYLRLFNVYGPGEPAARIIPHIIACAARGEKIELTGCEQLRDFMFVDDLIDILLRLLSDEAGFQTGSDVLNVGTGIPTPLKALVEETVNALKSRGLEPDVRFGALAYRKEDPMFCFSDNGKLLQRIGNYPFTSLRDGVGKTVEKLA